MSKRGGIALVFALALLGAACGNGGGLTSRCKWECEHIDACETPNYDVDGCKSSCDNEDLDRCTNGEGIANCKTNCADNYTDCSSTMAYNTCAQGCAACEEPSL